MRAVQQGHAAGGGEGRRLGRLVAATEGGRLAAALSVAFDRVGAVRDALGAVDDDVRRLVGERVTACVGPVALTWAAPDELVVALGTEAAADVERLAGNLLAALRRPFPIRGHLVRLGPSIGVARAEHGAPEEALPHAAGVAMRRAREDGGTRVRLFEPAMAVAARRRLRLEDELGGALERGELEVHYQPQVDLRRGVVVGAEALLRWRHPRLGLLTPDAFLAMAEDDGSVVDIDRWVIDQACRQARRWIDAGARLEAVAVNVSPETLTGTDVVGTVATALVRSGLPAGRLEVEVSERVVAGRRDAERAVAGLRALGAHVAVDDFGTGYSSLAHLKRLPVSTVKLDRSFVADVRDRPRAEDVAVIRAVVAIARDLRLRCIGEGVETAAQRRVLGTLRCRLAQGHLYGRAVPADGWALGRRARLAAG